MTLTPIPLFVTPDWLANQLDNPNIVVLDASCVIVGVARDGWVEYQAGHIAGARFFDIDAIALPGSPLPHMLPTAEHFAQQVAAMGISNTTHVICTDGFGLLTAARAWWMFKVMGHDAVSVLEGGLPRWQREGHPISRGITPPPTQPGQFIARFRPERVRSADQVATHLLDGAATVLDARAAGRFTGEAAEPWPGRRQGHMPGARNLPFNLLLDSQTGGFLPVDVVQQLFAEAGISSDKSVIASCGSGVTACVLAMGLAYQGHDDWAVYDGSWAEWGLPESGRPVVTGLA